MKALTLFVILVLASPLLAQTGQPAKRPPLFFSESWKPLPTPPDDHGAWPASQGGVASSNLELALYGTTGKEIQLVAVRGDSNVYPLNKKIPLTYAPLPCLPHPCPPSSKRLNPHPPHIL